MTPVAGALTITWINQYVGLHRVCYRLGLIGTYTCITVNCPNPAGSSNSTIIPVLVDNESCDTVEWDVYVQAECEDINSVTGRVYVSPIPTFVPSPTCLPQLFTCTNAELIGFTISNAGTNYTGIETATVNGVVTAITIGTGSPTDMLIAVPGAGGPAGPIDYLAVASVPSAGVGVGTFTVRVVAGAVTVVTPDPGCTGFVGGVDIFGFNPADIGGTVGTVVNVNLVDTGTVIDITLPPPLLYAVPPTVIIQAPNPGPGTTATATALLGGCPDGWDAGTNCLGDAYGNFPFSIAQGETLQLCYDGGTYDGPDDLPTDYGLILTAGSDCCYDCVDVTFTNATGASIDYTYVDCATKSINTASLANGASITIDCVVNGSWTFNDTGITIATNSPGTC